MSLIGGLLTAFSAESCKSMKPEEWTNRFTQQLTSMVEALSVLYDGLEEESGDGSVTDKTLTDNESFPEVVTTFIQRCQNLVCMMSEPTNGPVKLPLGPLLKAVSRCLRVSYVDVRAMPSMSELAGVLPTLHRAALEILSQLVLSCKTSVLPESRMVVDLCMQALTSAKHMGISEKSKTRACAYQALCLVVQMFGWGQYMTRQAKSFIQELTTDIKWQNSAIQTLSIESNNKKKQDTFQGRKKGKKKRNKAESYVDLVKTDVADGKKVIDYDTADFQATIGALELAKLMLGQVGFSSVESLMRCIVDTTQMFDHEEPPMDSPYIHVLCKRDLHAAVFACATVRLEPGCSRKDAITHFQLTNLALSILVNGMNNRSCYEVQSVCRESLNILQITGNLNRPIVRRIQPEDSVSTRDETELEGEIEKVREENSNLQRKLLDSDLEIQLMKSIEASLREELKTLKASKSNTDKVCAEQWVYLTDPEDNRLQTIDHCLLETDSEEDESEDEEVAKKQAEGERVEDCAEDTENEHQQNQAAERNNREEGTSQESQDSHRLLSKRKYPQKQISEPLEEKKSKVDFSKSDDIIVSDVVQDMITDFVEADADTDS